MRKQGNHLIGSNSPYLLEHVQNPVDWYPWGDEALDKARREDKPIFLSVGYSSCHWCHVMARESFEDPDVAKSLNAHFVAIKVDREERPDIDDTYMLAVQMLTGSGGWPMSVMLTPDRKPFFGATYLPRAHFLDVLEQVADLWRPQRTEIDASAERLVVAMRGVASADSAGAFDPEAEDRAVAELARRFDAERGGFSPAPKFPSEPQVLFLLDRHARTGDPKALGMAVTTLDQIARGGIRDHLGGGFHRYSTDGEWRVPHFEKMLYNQAQLALAYLRAALQAGRPDFKDPARETLEFALREMRDPAGGFWSALDADSEGEEGRFYVWTAAEIGRVLGGDAAAFGMAFGVQPGGNFRDEATNATTGTNILHLDGNGKGAASPLPELRSKLLEVRAGRVRPHTDDKVLTGWNGMMLRALAVASVELGEPRYLEAACQISAFLKAKMWKDGGLLRSFRKGKADVDGGLEDYAQVVRGLLELHRATGVPVELAFAREVADAMVLRFGGGEGAFVLHAGDGALVSLKSGEDGAVQNANGVAAVALALLGHVTGDATYAAGAAQILGGLGKIVGRMPSAFPTLLTARSTLASSRSSSSEDVVSLLADPEEVVAGGAGRLSMRVRDGWHVNGPGAKGLVPATVELESPKGWTVIPHFPVERERIGGEVLEVLAGAVPVEIVFQPPGGTPAGLYLVEGVVGWQACSETACLRPARRTVTFRVRVS